MELVLNGIGGRTVHEARSNLTGYEIRLWQAYVEKRGSLNVGRRIEQEVAKALAGYMTFNGAFDVHAVRFMSHETGHQTAVEDDGYQDEMALMAMTGR